MEKVAVVVPDRGCEATTQFLRGEGILAQLKESLDKPFICPMLNGLPPDEMRSLEEEAVAHGLHPAITEESVNHALSTGYDVAGQLLDWSGSIIRMDRDGEHRVEDIELMLQTVREAEGVVVGDLKYSEELLRPGTADWFWHEVAFPGFYATATDGKIIVGCAHGFTAVRAAKMASILPNANKIWQMAEALYQNPITWGFDATINLSALALGIPIKIINLQGHKTRDREPQKGGRQAVGHLFILLAAYMLHTEELHPVMEVGRKRLSEAFGQD